MASLEIYPAIDLKGGQCVRLYKGDMDQATVFNDSPGDQAGSFVAAGARWLHVVDLDGAFAGEAVNAAAVEAIIASSGAARVQLGGGVRSVAAAGAWLEKGLSRVILGTVAVREPQVVREACKAFPGQVAVGVDARGGKVAVEGWAETSELEAVDLARRFEDCGVAAVIYTDIDRDGAMTGVNVQATEALARAVSMPVIASGGVASLADLQALGATGVIAGAITGRALYEGAIDLAEALALAA
ncbi:MAG: 1-(5-phosphoribosyl)-5-[(5-phosphoribosylamino)methylideneamino]imidazole-4-carboxamide isomerase [Alphaproteobacteria bacterium]|nr:1-(5-phosphoribosyl)-5-[(5-phosphoribosylamino)methylideneamino]imidazole-4-carboxamide isomerase [Alphaproteobacteria bacterium]